MNPWWALNQGLLNEWLIRTFLMMSFVVNEINWFLENLHLPVTVPSLFLWPCCISEGNCLPFCLLAQIFLSGLSEIISNVPSSMLSSKTPIHHLPIFCGLLSSFLCSWLFEFFFKWLCPHLDMCVGKDFSFLHVLVLWQELNDLEKPDLFHT